MLIAAGMLTGCGSAAETTLPVEWSARTGEATTVYVEPYREDVVMAEDKNLSVLDGASGQRIYGEREGLSFGRLVRESVSVGNFELSSLSAEGFSFAFLDEQGVVLVFDYTESDDIIRAIDLNTSEERWEQTGYQWSLQKYQAVGGQLATSVLRNVGIGAATATAAVAAEITRLQYTQRLVVTIPDENAILLKTVGALKRIDLATGEEVWSLDDIDGSSLQQTKMLPNGDMILLVNYSGMFEALSGGREMVRINPQTGERIWQANYATDLGDMRETVGAEDVRAIRVLDDAVLLQHDDGEVEVFDLETGALRFRSDPGTRPVNRSEERDVNYYLTSPSVVDGPALYVPRAENRRPADGRADRFVGAFDWSSGEERYASEALEGYHDMHDLTLAGSLLMGRLTSVSGSDQSDGPHQTVAAWRTDDGTLAWSATMPYRTSAAILSPDFMSYERPAPINLVVNGDVAYTTSDTSIVALEVATGTVQATASLPSDALGAPALLIDEDDALAVLHRQGMSFVAKDSLATGPTVQFEFENPLISVKQRGDHLFVGTQNRLRDGKRELYVINLPEQRLVGSLNLEDTTRRAGNLLNGYAVTENGRSLYRLTDDGRLTKYRLP